MDVVLVLEDVQYMLRNWLKEPTGILTVTAFHILEAEVIHLCIHLFNQQPFINACSAPHEGPGSGDKRND